MRGVLCLLRLAGLAVIATSAFAQGNSLCSGNAGITITTSGNTTIIAPRAGQNIHVCKVTFAATAASTVTLESVTSGGTYTALGNPPMAPYQAVQYFTYDFTGDLTTGLGNGFALNFGSAVTAGGMVTFYVTSL